MPTGAPAPCSVTMTNVGSVTMTNVETPISSVDYLRAGPFDILSQGYGPPFEGRQRFSLELYHYDQRRVIGVEMEGSATNTDDPDFDDFHDKKMVATLRSMIEWTDKYIVDLPREVTQIVLSDGGDLLEQFTEHDMTGYVNYPSINK